MFVLLYTIMPNPLFDTGFSHVYPAEKGLIEELLENERVIIERVANNDGPLFTDGNDFCFPVRVTGRYNYYLIPPEARDLSSYIRLIKQQGIRTAVSVGNLLGNKLLQIHTESGFVPSDTIVNRFSVIQSSNAAQLAFGGIDLRLLPPYTDIDAPLDSVQVTLERDVDEIGGDSVVMQQFIGATLEKIHHDK